MATGLSAFHSSTLGPVVHTSTSHSSSFPVVASGTRSLLGVRNYTHGLTCSAALVASSAGDHWSEEDSVQALLRSKVPYARANRTTRRLCMNVATERAAVDGDVESGDTIGRRQVLTGVAALAATTTKTNCALAASAPKGFTAVLDNADGYAFYYPFGWQEVVVKGQDVAFKDVIEPLESVSVSIVKTDKVSLDELGSPDEVAKALVEKVLSSPTQKTTLKQAKERVTNGKTYYQFEFTAEAKNFTRHAFGAVAVSGGKFFTLTTGANERRWNKIEDKLRQVVESFTTL